MDTPVTKIEPNGNRSDPYCWERIKERTISQV